MTNCCAAGKMLLAVFITLCSSLFVCGAELQWQTLQWKSQSSFSREADGTLMITRDDVKRSSAWCSSKLETAAGETYKLDCEIATELSAGRAEVTVEFLNGKGKRLTTALLLRISGNKSFRKYSKTFKIPENCKSIRILAISQHSSGVVKFRNISVKNLTADSSDMQWHELHWKGKSKFSREADGTLMITRDDVKRSSAWCSSTTKVSAGETYRLICETAVELSAGCAEVTIEYLNSKGKRLSTASLFRVHGKKPFKKYSKTFKIPEQCHSIRILAISQHSNGIVRFRNISLQKISDEKQKVPDIKFQAGGFVWTPVSNRGKNEFTADTGKFIINTLTPDDSSGYWQSSPVSVTHGQHYHLTANIAGEKLKGIAAVGVLFFDSRGKKLSFKRLCSIRKSRSFLVCTATFTVPANAASMRFNAILNGNGKAFFRNISLKKLRDDLIFSAGAHTMPDNSTRIYWRTAIRINIPATVRLVIPGAADIVRTVKFSGAENHKLDFPAGTIPDGKNITATISYQDKSETNPSCTIKFISGTKKRIAASKQFSIRLTVSEPTATPRKMWPVRCGIPFNQGVLRDSDDAMLIDGSKKIIPANFTVFSRWQDGSVQFLTCDFETPTETGTKTVYFLTNRDHSKKMFGNVSTKLDEQLRDLKLEIITAGGKKLSALPYTEKQITSNSVCETLNASGKFNSAENFGWRILARAYPSGTTHIKWSIFGGSADTLIRSAAWKLPALKNPADSKKQPLPGKFSHLQRDYNNGTGDGFVCDRASGFAVAMRHYRETWPKGIKNDTDSLELQILPPLPADYPSADSLAPMDILMNYYWLKDGCYIFRAGMELSGEFTVSTTGAERSHLSTPLLASASPEYYCQTGVFEKISPQTPGAFDRYEKIIERSYEQFEQHRKKICEYGWMNFGDWFGERYYNWGNNEYDLAFLMALMYVRTGKPHYYFRGLEMAEHYQTIDRHTHLAQPMDKKVKYKHAVGHVGNFFDKKDTRFKNFNLRNAYIPPAFDREGGHDFENGSLLMAALAGDDYMFRKTLENIEHIARVFTPAPIIGIERSFGWLLDNLVSGLFFTSDPYLRNGADICVENVMTQQAPVSGSMNLPQSSSCGCPDNIDHQGGKPFAVGVLMHALINYYHLTGNEKVKNSVILMANWLLSEGWDKELELFRYRTGCPVQKGRKFYPLVVDGMLMAGEWSNDKRYEKMVLQYLGRYFPQIRQGTSSQGVGKNFVMAYRHMPHVFHLLAKQGISDLPVTLSKYSIRVPVPSGAKKIEAEDFAYQSGGKVHLRHDKIGADVSLSHWAKAGHKLSWNLKNQPGKYKILVRYCTDRPNAARKIYINGSLYGDTGFPLSGGLGEIESDWNTVYISDTENKPLIFELPENAEFSMEAVKDSVNLDCFYLEKLN